MKYFFAIGLLYLISNCSTRQQPAEVSQEDSLASSILSDETFSFVKEKARQVVKSGFNAGDGYGEVWIRDYNTFIELSSEVIAQEDIRENLLVFFRMQGEDGNIIDGFIPVSKVQEGGYEYIYSQLEPRYAGHKNTVETDQETSLIQAVYKYVIQSDDRDFLNVEVGDFTVLERLELALEFLMQERFDKEYGLLWGATTADWGDVQPEHDWGVYLTDDTHIALDIYDNAMFLIAVDNYLELNQKQSDRWVTVSQKIRKNVRTHLWDDQNQKFLPHIYTEGSPFPEDFDEDRIFYHGGTAVAIEADLLTKKEVKASLDKMIANVEAIGAASIGLTLYPAYPDGFFMNKGMYPYGYQNGGDWTWFGGRMIQQLVRYGYIQEAYEQLVPMTRRVQENDGFFEWYTIKNEPMGSGTFRGSAGVLYKSIAMLEDWAKNQ